MYKNPEQFSGFEVEGTQLPMGSKAPYIVYGLKSNGWDSDRTVIKGDFQSHRLAEVWLEVYLERYTRLHMFGNFPLDETADYEPLDK